MSSPSKKRGSAILFVLFMVLAISAIVVVGAELGMSDIRQEIRYEDQALAQRTWDAAVAQLNVEEQMGTLTLPNTLAFSLNGVTGTVTTVDNSSSMANSMLATCTLTVPDGRTYPESSILAKTIILTPFEYALFSNNGFTSPGYLFNTGSGGLNGDIFSNGTVSITGSGTASSNVVNGSIYSTSTITASVLTITGAKVPNDSMTNFPSVTSASYLNVAATSTNANSLTGISFSGTNPDGTDPVDYYSNAAVNVSGAYSGSGTVYFAGNVTVNNTMSYSNGSSEVAFIVAGNLHTNGQPLIGYWYVGGTVTSAGGSLSNSRGGLVANTFSPGTSTNIVMDPAVKNSVALGNNLHLPGYTWNGSNDLAGSYSGTYTVSGAGDSGTMSLTISGTGTVTGTIHDNDLGSGTVIGTITEDGSFSGTYNAAGTVFTANGTLTLTGATLSGTITASNGTYGTYLQAVTLTD